MRVLILVLVIPFAARAAGEGEIRNYIFSISRLYESLDYELALNRIQLARQLPRGTDEEVTLSLYEGIILCEMGKQEPGATAFRAALFLRPDAKLPVLVAPKVKALFDSVRKHVKSEMDSLGAPREKEFPPNKTDPVQKNPSAPAPTGPAERQQVDAPPKGAATAESIDAEPQQKEQQREAKRRETERDELKKKRRAELDTSMCQPVVWSNCELLMQRLRFLQEAFLGTAPPSRDLPIKELNRIGQEIRAARTGEELKEAAHALDFWEQQHLPQ
ncbi:hypothetical protein DAT35_05590 [Vitiosangium sp. GDMCC 1.1324]|nr:hypothetical protein DAT35_05590 [Vitiosangium sp. GDMCC 1.1324]